MSSIDSRTFAKEKFASKAEVLTERGLSSCLLERPIY